MLPLLATGAGLLAQGAGSFLAGNSQAKAAKEAARLQAEANQKAIDFQKGVYSDAQGNFNPYIETGKRGLTGLESAITNFTQPTMNYQQKDFNLGNWKDPGYDFRLNEAQKLINASTASKGMTLGSGAAKSLQQRGQDMASQEYGNAFDRYLKDSAMRYGQASDQYTRDFGFGTKNIENYGNLAGIGKDAAASLAGVGTSTGGLIGKQYDDMGSAFGNAALAGGAANAAGWNTLGSGLGKLITDGGEYWQSYNPSSKTNDNTKTYIENRRRGS